MEMEQDCFDGELTDGQCRTFDLAKVLNYPCRVEAGPQILKMLYSDALVSTLRTASQPSIVSVNEKICPYFGYNFDSETKSSDDASTPAAGENGWNICESCELWAWEAAAGPGEEDPFKEDWAAWVSDSHQTSTV